MPRKVIQPSPKSRMLEYLERLTAIIADNDDSFIEPWMDTTVDTAGQKLMYEDLASFVATVAQELRDSMEDLVEHLPREAARIAAELTRLENEIRGNATRRITVTFDVTLLEGERDLGDDQIVDRMSAYFEGDELFLQLTPQAA